MSINPKNFNTEYYHSVCFGSEEFKKSRGKKISVRVRKMIDSLSLDKTMDVLEIGCGRGDTALYIAKKVKSVVAVDYSLEAIKIANRIKKLHSKNVQNKVRFLRRDACELSFKNGSFNLILLIDTLDHLNKREQVKMFRKVNLLLKKDGGFFIRTCSNRTLLSYTYKYYSYPVNQILTFLDKKIKRTNYESLPQNPRTREQSKQHINEPTYLSLKKLFRITGFTGKIGCEVGLLKEGNGTRTKIYNFFIAFFPISKYFPLKILFASSFVCFLKKSS